MRLIILAALLLLSCDGCMPGATMQYAMPDVGRYETYDKARFVIVHRGDLGDSFDTVDVISITERRGETELRIPGQPPRLVRTPDFTYKLED